MRPLGTTGLWVTPCSVGCAPLGNVPEDFTYEVGEEQALEPIRAIFAGHSNFIDTAASRATRLWYKRRAPLSRDLFDLVNPQLQ